MKEIKAFVIMSSALLIITLTACAYVTASDEFNPYVGKPVALAVAEYGQPTSQTTTDGNKYYSWDDIERHHAGSFPGVRSICKLTMMVDAKGIVTAYTIHKTGGSETLDSCR